MKKTFEKFLKPLPLNMDLNERNIILKKLKITQPKFEELGLCWDELEKIYVPIKNKLLS